MVIRGHPWASVGISGPSVVISGHQWQSVAISGRQWSSALYCRHQWSSSVTISDHQEASVVISECDGAQIEAKCVVDVETSGVGINTPPLTVNRTSSIGADGSTKLLVPVQLALDLKPARLQLSDTINEYTLLLGNQYSRRE